ncbi:DNA helicase PriA [Aquimarina algicola]|uniref:DNA helicase PriA n=1 Tax=Aquimarina algicola TaxID=2589995 RepID=A0A504JCL0_9FLAO|nr:DNA helicase PriA [Aquimarina algicola]TPN84071.1 DNA helicase PriA [Aquimarina algicola]
MREQKKAVSEQKKSCVNCGAELKYKPGTTNITCEYCGHQETIIQDKNGFKELELKPYLQEMGAQSHSEKIMMLHCKNCGANQHVEENYKSLHCVYCTMPLIIEDAYKEDWILPGALIPFQFDQKKSHQIFSKWVKGLWFAPNNLKKAALDPQYTKGLYLPYWTFDAQLYANYRGQRGDYYYVSVPYTTTVNGKTVRRTRQERRTRWTSVSGHIQGFVDDTLIKASRQQENPIPKKISNWNLKALESFNTSFLAGFVTEKYTIPLKEGHLASTKEAEQIATNWARRDIGGDRQRVHDLQMSLSDETFKHILLPVYISSYRYSGKKYNFFINGQTGKISGGRPYSFWKIFFTVLLIICIIIVIYLLLDS